jgi:ubiquinone/menaquinone biosynthesis C-methylase UbiE
MMLNRSLKDEITDYWNARAATFDRSPGHGIAAGGEREAWRALLNERLGGLEGRRVLELASGTGEFTQLLAGSGAEVTGIDLCENMLARARPKLAQAGHRAALYLGDAEETREASASFDAVVCRHLVWTLTDPARAFADWLRVLRPGGLLLVIDGDWARLPAWGRLRRAAGYALMALLRTPTEPMDWDAHERIMRQLPFGGGLRPEPLAEMLLAEGFGAVETGSIAAIRREQRRAAPFPRSLTVGVYRDFWMSAAKPAV